MHTEEFIFVVVMNIFIIISDTIIITLSSTSRYYSSEVSSI